MSWVRVLVVDDYEPFRRFICSALKRMPDLEIIGEALDGLEAVQKSEALRPDLIMLDLGLPGLNGIEAARRIRKLSPESKMLFVSQESSADLVQEALGLGALGYVVKAHAGSELLAAVEAVRQGRQFIGSGLTGLLSSKDAHGATRPEHEEATPSLASGKGDITRTHEVRFYSDEEFFLVGFTHFIEAALLAKNAVIAVATESHQSSLSKRLRERGVNLDAAIEEGRYLPLGVAQTLSAFMVNDLPDPVQFHKVTSELVASAAKAAKGEPPRVAACGECSPVLWAGGTADAAIQLEHLWDEIAKTYDVDVLCGYVLTDFQRKRQSHILDRICGEHSAVQFD